MNVLLLEKYTVLRLIYITLASGLLWYGSWCEIVYIGWWWWWVKVKPQVAYWRAIVICVGVLWCMSDSNVSRFPKDSFTFTCICYIPTTRRRAAVPSSTRKCANDVYLGNLIISFLILSLQDVGGTGWLPTRQTG